MKNKNQPQQLDLFTPFVEIFHEVCMLLFDLVKSLVILGYQKAFDVKPPIKKIEANDLNVKKQSKSAESLGFDVTNRCDLKLDSIDFKKHSFIAGASGFGKTNLISILQENALRRDKPIIFFDPKGDRGALNIFKQICEKYKRPCYIFSEHYEDSISLNPILEGTINQVADRIMRSFEWESTFYHDECKNSLIDVLVKLEKQKIPFTIREILAELQNLKNNNNTGIITKLRSIQYSDFGKILNGSIDGLTLSKIREEKACLYIGLSTQGYGETAIGVGKLFLGELLYNSYKTLSNHKPEEGLKNPISVYFDEFGSLVTPEFIELQNKCRGAGIELTLAVQGVADIDRVNPHLTKQVIENAANFFIFKQRDPSAASYFAEAIGTILSKKSTYRMEEGKESSDGSIREVNVLAAHSDQIKNLNIGQCIFLAQGPTRLSLVNVRNRKWDSFIDKNREKKSIPELF